MLREKESFPKFNRSEENIYSEVGCAENNKCQQIVRQCEIRILGDGFTTFANGFRLFQ